MALRLSHRINEGARIVSDVTIDVIVRKINFVTHDVEVEVRTDGESKWMRLYPSLDFQEIHPRVKIKGAARKERYASIDYQADRSIPINKEKYTN